MKGEIELYNISFLILKVELHFKESGDEAKLLSIYVTTAIYIRLIEKLVV